MEPAGGYGELSARHELERLAPPRGRSHRRARAVDVLVCDCGEAGCWPLRATMTADGGTVTWSRFRQPHRPRWSYDGFGPFVFDREQYDAATGSALAGL